MANVTQKRFKKRYEDSDETPSGSKAAGVFTAILTGLEGYLVYLADKVGPYLRKSDNGDVKFHYFGTGDIFPKPYVMPKEYAGTNPPLTGIDEVLGNSSIFLYNIIDNFGIIPLGVGLAFLDLGVYKIMQKLLQGYYATKLEKEEKGMI